MIALCQIADVFTVLGDTASTDPAVTAKLTAQILSASTIFFNKTSLNPLLFSTVPSSFTEFYRGRPGLRKIALRQQPIISVQSISSPYSFFETIALSPDGFLDGFTHDSLTLSLVGYWETVGFPYSFSVTYTAGYTGIPADLSNAVAATVALWKKQGKNIGIMSEGIQGATSIYDKKSIPQVMLDAIGDYSSKVPWLS